MPLSCRLTCAHFGELFCTALCCNVLSATAVTLGARVCLPGAERCPGHQDCVCVVCACLGPSTLEHELVGLGMCRAGKDGILFKHWLKREVINSFKGLGYPNRLQGNLSSTETVNLLTWERRYQDCTSSIV